ncbi:hypothetical protein GVAV_003141 [Gurleya vavrai]
MIAEIEKIAAKQKSILEDYSELQSNFNETKKKNLISKKFFNAYLQYLLDLFKCLKKNCLINDQLNFQRNRIKKKIDLYYKFVVQNINLAVNNIDRIILPYFLMLFIHDTNNFFDCRYSENNELDEKNISISVKNWNRIHFHRKNIAANIKEIYQDAYENTNKLYLLKLFNESTKDIKSCINLYCLYYYK